MKVCAARAPDNQPPPESLAWQAVRPGCARGTGDRGVKQRHFRSLAVAQPANQLGEALDGISTILL